MKSDVLLHIALSPNYRNQQSGDLPSLKGTPNIVKLYYELEYVGTDDFCRILIDELIIEKAVCWILPSQRIEGTTLVGVYVTLLCAQSLGRCCMSKTI